MSPSVQGTITRRYRLGLNKKQTFLPYSAEKNPKIKPTADPVSGRDQVSGSKTVTFSCIFTW